MFNNMKIGVRLYLLVAISAVLLVIIGILGLRSASQSNAGLKTVYEDRTVALGQLDHVIRWNNRNRINLEMLVIHPTPEEVKNRTEEIQKNIQLINEEWKAYTSTYMTQEEKTLADKFAEARKEFRDKALLPAVEAARAGRIDEVKRIVIEVVSPLSRPLTEATDKLIKLQLDEAKHEYENSQQSYVLSRNLSMSAIVLGIGLMFALAWWIINSITKPLGEGVKTMENISNSDLRVNIDVSSTDETGKMLSAMKDMVSKLKQIISTIKTSADSVASASQQLSASSEQMSRGVMEQSGRASQIATSTTEMSQTVVDIARNASNIASSANETLNSAHEGSSVVNKTVNEVQDIAKTVSDLSAVMISLGDRSKQIGDIVSVIKDIADQTNLLALNAAIEAARAGEQGRGFAVVADEVRKLAERTAKATSEIEGMIGGIQTEVGHAVESMNEASDKVTSGVNEASKAGEALNTIVRSVEGLQSMVQQIASATEEMSTVSETISSDIETVASVSNETSSSSNQIAESASDLARLSSDLQGIVSQFKL